MQLGWTRINAGSKTCIITTILPCASLITSTVFNLWTLIISNRVLSFDRQPQWLTCSIFMKNYSSVSNATLLVWNQCRANDHTLKLLNQLQLNLDETWKWEEVWVSFPFERQYACFMANFFICRMTYYANDRWALRIHYLMVRRFFPKIMEMPKTIDIANKLQLFSLSWRIFLLWCQISCFKKPKYLIIF